MIDPRSMRRSPLARGVALAIAAALFLVACAGGGTDPLGPEDQTESDGTSTDGGETGALSEAIEERATEDRPDDTSGKQVHVLYVVPADGTDDELDLDGTLAGTVAVTDDWVHGLTGYRIPFDTFDGRLDITFVRATGTAAEYEAAGPFIRDELERELRGSGFDEPDKIYAAYYAGPAEDCASAFQPGELEGNMVGLYWVHKEAGSVQCNPDEFRSPGEPAGEWEHALAHELFHGFGAVQSCAPNYTEAGHTSDSRFDLLYAGEEEWQPTTIDVNNDDYFNHGRSDCLDLADSEWLVPSDD